MTDHTKIDWTKTDMRARITELEAQLTDLAEENERLRQEVGEQQDRHIDALFRAGAVKETDVMVCPQCEGEGTYADGLDDAACTTTCTRCESNGWIVNIAHHSRDTDTEPPAPEGQQPVAHAYVIDGECEQIEWGLDVDLPDDISLVLLYNRPSEQALTEAIAKIEQTFPARTWGLLPRFFSDKEWGGLIFAEGSQDILKATIAAGDTPAGALNAALKAAMEAGG